MKQKKKFQIDFSLYHEFYPYWHNGGTLHVHDEEMILSDLKRRINWYAELLPKFWQATLVDRRDLDRYLQFTGNKRILNNDWEFTSEESYWETIILTFEVEFLIPDSKKDAKNLQKFTF